MKERIMRIVGRVGEKKLITYAILLVFFFLLSFGSVLDSILENNGLVRVDIAVFDMIRNLRLPALNDAMLFVTLFGKGFTVTLGVLFLMLVFGLYKKWDYLWLILLTVASGQLFVTITKNLIQRVRPPFISALVREDTFSFPSGHTFVAVTFYGLLTYLVFRIAKKTWQKILVVALGVMIILAISFSRVYLGAHWFTDVLGSLAAGSFWLVSAITIFEVRSAATDKHKNVEAIKKDKILLFTILFIIWLSSIVYWYLTKKF